MVIRYALPILFLFATHLSNAQAGALDPTFGEDGIASASYDGSDEVTALVVLPDDAIVVAGYSYLAGTTMFAKFTPDGQTFPGFGTNGITALTFDPEKAYVCDIAATPDGKLLVGGFIWGVDYNVRTSFLARLHADGSPDMNFGQNGIVEFNLDEWPTRAEGMALQADGKVLFTGVVGDADAELAFAARLNADGSMDTSFANSGIRRIYLGTLDQSGRAIMPLPDGGAVVACAASGSGGFNGVVLVRLNEDGTEDVDFGTDGYVYDPVLDPTENDLPMVLLPQTGNSVYLACMVRTSMGSSMGLLAFDSEGVRIPEYGTDGLLLVDFGNNGGAGDIPYALIPDDQGRITMVGTVFTSDENLAIGIARILPSGDLDDTFGDGGMVFDQDGIRLKATAAGMQADGRLIVAGIGYNWDNLDGSDYMVARYEVGTVGIPDQASAIAQLLVMPNPVADRFTLSFEHSANGPLGIVLLDMQGRTIHRFAQRNFPLGTQRTDLIWPADAAPGAYTIALISDQGTAYVKVIR